jgi:diguanylate cyclase (GGDEF)-like protein/PAS domain S-box-containing protein
MHYLDPSASVPDRVRKALDTLNEGLLIVDQQARIVLANRAFREMHPAASGELNGKRLHSLDWLSAGAAGSAPPPWEQTLGSGTPVAAHALALPQPEGGATQLLVSSSAILDNRGHARGCLITFDNVTAVHRANEELRLAMVEREKSRGRSEQQNEDLRRLASRDSLTGCLNRRAFFELAGAAHGQALREQAPLCCLMVDIDHFKSFNDTYGHAVGDQVIQAVARSLSAGLRQVDLLGRYGGEEFCVLLPGANEAQAMAVAERMRAEIENSASSAIRGTEVMPITASFGLTTLAQGARTIELMIDQADQALYLSKKFGRNRVTRWEPAAALA